MDVDFVRFGQKRKNVIGICGNRSKLDKMKCMVRVSTINRDMYYRASKGVRGCLFSYGQEIIVPLKFFIGNKLQFPLMMHDAVRDSLTSIMDMAKKSEDGTIDFLAILATTFGSINAKIPSSWMGFAFDVTSAYADRGHFVENSDQAGLEESLCFAVSIFPINGNISDNSQPASLSPSWSFRMAHGQRVAFFWS